jgi:hypothetical protein
VADEAAILEVGERRHRLLYGHVGIGRVVLVRIDRLDAEAVETTERGVPEVVGGAVAEPVPPGERRRPPFVATTASSGTPASARRRSLVPGP